MSKVKLELSPFPAITVLSFLNEFKSDMEHPQCKGLKEAFLEYQEVLIQNISDRQFEDAKAEIAVKVLLGKAPDNARSSK